MKTRYRIVKVDKYYAKGFEIQKWTWYWPFWWEVDRSSGNRGFGNWNLFTTIESAIEAVEKYKNPELKVVYYL